MAEYSAGEEKRTSGTKNILVSVALVVALVIGAAIGHFATGSSNEPESPQTDTVASEPTQCPRNGWIPEEERSPMGEFRMWSKRHFRSEFRRTTLCVYNMTRSLEFYEHGLGMTKMYGEVNTSFPEVTISRQLHRNSIECDDNGNCAKVASFGLFARQ